MFSFFSMFRPKISTFTGYNPAEMCHALGQLYTPSSNNKMSKGNLPQPYYYTSNDTIIFPPVSDLPEPQKLETLKSTIEQALENGLIKDNLSKILFPVAEEHKVHFRPRNHWVTLCFDLKTRQGTLYDSRPNIHYSIQPIQRALADAVQLLDTSLDTFNVVYLSIQKDHVNCGAWTAFCLQTLTEGNNVVHTFDSLKVSAETIKTTLSQMKQFFPTSSGASHQEPRTAPVHQAVDEFEILESDNDEALLHGDSPDFVQSIFSTQIDDSASTLERHDHFPSPVAEEETKDNQEVSPQYKDTSLSNIQAGALRSPSNSSLPSQQAFWLKGAIALESAAAGYLVWNIALATLSYAFPVIAPVVIMVTACVVAGLAAAAAYFLTINFMNRVQRGNMIDWLQPPPSTPTLRHCPPPLEERSKDLL